MTPRTIVTLALMQMLTVFFGVVLTAIFLRFLTTDWPNEPVWMPAFPRFMRNYGFWLLLLPVAWAGVSVTSVRSLDAWPQIHRGHLVAGYVLWAALALVFFFAVGIAYEAGLGSGPGHMQSSHTSPRPAPDHRPRQTGTGGHASCAFHA